MRPFSARISLTFAQLASSSQGASTIKTTSTTLQSSLSTALGAYPDLSTFQSLLDNNPTLLDSILPNTDRANVTVLIPNNAALAGAVLPVDQMLPILRYHFMVTALSGSDLGHSASGMTVPTLLRDEQFNNRSAGAALTEKFGAGAGGQVLFVSSSASLAGNGSSAVVKVRTGVPGEIVDEVGWKRQVVNTHLEAGLAQEVDVTVLDGLWEGGVFQGINAVLQPPAKCSTTTRKLANTLTALDTALNRTKFWGAVDHTPNVTCLGPNDHAFASAGGPEKTMSDGDLKNALLQHTLPMPLYSDFLVDGMEITSLANTTVRISVKGNGDIYFNDAMVVRPNVLTNNGLIHILDKVMTPLNGSNVSGSSSAGTGTASGTAASSTESAHNAGVSLTRGGLSMTSSLVITYFYYFCYW